MSNIATEIGLSLYGLSDTIELLNNVVKESHQVVNSPLLPKSLCSPPLQSDLKKELVGCKLYGTDVDVRFLLHAQSITRHKTGIQHPMTHAQHTTHRHTTLTLLFPETWCP
eukprot:TRINITY_DN28336_c0_g2_i1.p2 TRINITY_DN28336_c0_g2~~TRINITY_DN28336_c0_g2_i1.p2  ORF type:complete len:111 (-),score=18.93 TRINITY_DN28336_c0_g2_i1:488-820(-)